MPNDQFDQYAWSRKKTLTSREKKFVISNLMFQGNFIKNKHIDQTMLN